MKIRSRKLLFFAASALIFLTGTGCVSHTQGELYPQEPEARFTGPRKPLFSKPFYLWDTSAHLDPVIPALAYLGAVTTSLTGGSASVSGVDRSARSDSGTWERGKEISFSKKRLREIALAQKKEIFLKERLREASEKDRNVEIQP